MKKLLFILLLAAALPASAQTAPVTSPPSTTIQPVTAPPAAPEPAVLRLWEGDAPGALGQKPEDTPTLTVFLPAADKATGAAIVICPGGGYGGLAQHEGTTYAQYLAQFGITGFVLKYRLGSHGYRHPVMLQDAARRAPDTGESGGMESRSEESGHHGLIRRRPPRFYSADALR